MRLSVLLVPSSSFSVGLLLLNWRRLCLLGHQRWMMLPTRANSSWQGGKKGSFNELLQLWFSVRKEMLCHNSEQNQQEVSKLYGIRTYSTIILFFIIIIIKCYLLLVLMDLIGIVTPFQTFIANSCCCHTRRVWKSSYSSRQQKDAI